MDKFYICRHCGNLVEKIHDSGVAMVCCGKPMEELVANTSDGAVEKHVPVISMDGNCVNVQVGSVEHPMLEEHYIQWVYLRTGKGCQRVMLKAGDAPKAQFLMGDDQVVGVYGYCNLHGLWKALI